MNIIAFKIDAGPFKGVGEASEQVLGAALAFSVMLNDCVSAALHGNLYDAKTLPVSVHPIPTGFLCVASVLNLPDGLKTVENFIARLGLTNLCEIVTKGLFQRTWMHHAGPCYGDFESHFKEVVQWGEILKDARRQLPPIPPAP